MSGPMGEKYSSDMNVLALGRPRGGMVRTGKGLCSTVFWASLLGAVPEIGEDEADEMSIGTDVRCTSAAALPRLRCTSRCGPGLPPKARIYTVR